MIWHLPAACMRNRSIIVHVNPAGLYVIIRRHLVQHPVR